MKIERWDLSSTLGDDRLRYLASPLPYESILADILSSMRVICAHREPCIEVAEFARPVYCIRVPRQSFDLFYNSDTGYRASYFRSPFDGLCANREFINTIAPGLLDWGLPDEYADRNSVEESFACLSAKVWLAEPERGICSKCDGEWSDPKDAVAEIENDRWELGDSVDHRRGRKAPRFEKLRIFGAFTNSRFDELIPFRKRNRPTDISETGWA